MGQHNTDARDRIHDIPMLSRTPGRDIFGKLDDKLPEVRIPAHVRIDAERAASELGLDLTAWLRELVYESLYTAEHLGSLYEERAKRVRGNARHGDLQALPVREMGPS
jgi:hypothetical protein